MTLVDKLMTETRTQIEFIPLRNRALIDGRTPVTAEEWDKKPKDYKSTPDCETHPSMTALGRDGGTWLFPVVLVAPKTIGRS